MSTMSETSLLSYLQHLLFLCQSGEMETLRVRLKRPLTSSPIPEEASDRLLEELLFRLEKTIKADRDLFFLFHANLLSSSLILAERSPAGLRRFVVERVDHKRFLPFGPEEAACWAEVPVAEAVSSHAALRFWVLGWAPRLAGGVLVPRWAAELLDSEARQAMEYAAQAARCAVRGAAEGAFIAFPLCSPGKAATIRGRSHGLPIGMAFAALLNSNGKAPEGPMPAATGVLDPDGRVRRVGMLEIKAACFRREIGVRPFLYPKENDVPEECPLEEALPVSSLEEALFIRDLYCVPGEAQRIPEFMRMLENPKAFVAGCANLPPQWLRWAVANGRHAGIVEPVLSSPKLLKELLHRVQSALNSWDLALASAICAVLDPEAVEQSSGTFPLAAFRWFVLNLALANHEGDIDRAEDFGKRAGALLERVEEVAPDDAAQYFACRMVADHNRYRFVPEIPADLSRTLARLETRYSAIHPSSEKGFDLALGSLYGTIGQNFAFCGPRHLESALTWFAKARAVLGEGTVPDYAPEWKRQLHYAVFSLLDAGKLVDAENELCRYLETPALAVINPGDIPRDPPWGHNLLARFLADAFPPGPAERYLEWAASSAFAPSGTGHPWQLWTYNVGRIALQSGNPRAAGLCFHKSLELCLNGKPTVCVMALLPLSGLLALGEEPADFIAAEKQIAAAAAHLNAVHFETFLNRPLLSALEENRTRLAAFFPFMYR